MIRILNIVGARPQIIKAAAISRSVREKYSNQIDEILLHTGQHYDHQMSDVFFQELGIPEPTYNLNIGSGRHGQQTAAMISGLEDVILKEQPDFVVIYGDTNSTVAAALAASKLHIPLAHIEAGMRSFNKSMPEEINRIMSDHVSSLLFSPTMTGITNLVHEGFKTDNVGPYNIDNPGVFHCGDIMYDNAIYYKEKALNQINIKTQYGVVPEEYVLVTLHRPANTDNVERLNQIFDALLTICTSSDISIVLPIHPRTAKILEQSLSKNLFNAIHTEKRFIITNPASFFEIIALETNSKMVITDSGGVQKEAYFYNKPSIILRPETEWTELVDCGSALLADASKNRIIESFEYFNAEKDLVFPSIFGNGDAAGFICKTLIENSI